MLYSIIIPIYNTSKYLNECLTGLFRQDFSKEQYEIVLVDDASTENISEVVNHIIEVYVLNNVDTIIPHIQFIRHSNNKRQGGARNTGLTVAQGDYIFFLDSDDYWNATNVLSTFSLLLTCQKYDIIRSTLWERVPMEHKAKYEYLPYDNQKLQTNGISYLSDSTFSYEICSSCYRRNFILQHNLFFRENIAFEDSDWSVKAYWYAKKVCLIKYPFYQYRYNLYSTTNTLSVQTFKDNILSIAVIDDFIINKDDMPKKCRQVCYGRIKKSILSYVKLSRNFPIATSVECLNSINRKLLKDTRDYNLTIIDRVIFFLLLHCPIIIVAPIRVLLLIKRFTLKCLQK